MLHDLLVPPPVRLGPEAVDRGALAPVQEPVLDAGGVRRPGHLAPQGVQLPDQVALAGAADGRVAGHVAHRVQVDGKTDGLPPQPGRGQGCLDAGVAGADDRNIIFSCQKRLHSISLSLLSNQFPFSRVSTTTWGRLNRRKVRPLFPRPRDTNTRAPLAV